MEQSIMKKVAAFIVDKRKAFYLIFIVAMCFCVVGMSKVKVNNDITSYLPESTETKIGLNLMEDEFVTYATAKIMVSNITFEKALEIQEQLEQVTDVKQVDFDEDGADYVHSSALFTVTFNGFNEDSNVQNALEQCKLLLKDKSPVIQSEVGYDESAELKADMTVILLVACLIILVVLLFTSQSYAEIIVYAIVFSVSAVLNMGTNYLLGEISFITNAIAVVLQLALAIDYAIIFCHRFSDERKKYECRDAAIRSLAKAIPEIFASSLTTISGMIALMLMQLRIGFDMGMVLSKGIICSLLTVFLLMPGLLVMFDSLIRKSTHKNFVPNITFWGNGVIFTRYFLPFMFVFVVIFSIIFSGKCDFVFDYNSISSNKVSSLMQAQKEIEKVFGKENVLGIVVKAGDYQSEKEILQRVSELEGVKKAVGLANVSVDGDYMLTDEVITRQFADLVGTDIEKVRLLYRTYGLKHEQYQAVLGDIDEYQIPILEIVTFLGELRDQGVDFLEDDQKEEFDDLLSKVRDGVSQLKGENYSRLILTLNTDVEGEEVEKIMGEIRGIVLTKYNDCVLVGNSTSAKDLKASFQNDNLKISILTILFVAVILLFTFKSAGIPILLITTIQGSIWINFSFPYITGNNMYFLSYLIISAIQMGATIDYAIVITNRYQVLKNKFGLKKAIIETLNQCFPTILTSGSILTISGFLIGGISSDPTISSIGITLGRGSLISIILVMTVLPQILLLGNMLIEKTAFTLSSEFENKKDSGSFTVDGYVKGFVSGTIDAQVKGTLTGDLDVYVKTTENSLEKSSLDIIDVEVRERYE